MSQRGIEVNPAGVLKGDSIAISSRRSVDEKTGAKIIIVNKSKKVGSVGFCPTQPEAIHIDNECYDTRFTTVIKTV